MISASVHDLNAQMSTRMFFVTKYIVKCIDEHIISYFLRQCNISQ